MAPISLASIAESITDTLVRRQYEFQHSHPPPHRDWAPLGVSVAMLIVAWTTIALRLYTRAYVIFAIGWDDICMILALIFFTAFAGADIKLTAIKSELEFMSMDTIIAAVKCWFIVDVFYCATIMMLKLSVGIFLLRIIIRKRHRWFVYGILTIHTIWCVATILFAIFQCGPPTNGQTYILKRMFGQCVSDEEVFGMMYTLSVLTSLSDFAFTLLPIFILKDAKMNKRAKLSLGVILGLGGLGSIASLVRFKYIQYLGHVSNDFFIKNGSLSIWCTLEMGLGISAGSLATLRPLFRRFLQSARTTISHTRSQISRRRSAYTKQPPGSPGSPRGSGSPRSSGSQRGSWTRVGSVDFGFVKHPFAHFKRTSSDLEIGCRGNQVPVTPANLTNTSEKVYDGSRIGTETTITVGMMQTPPKSLTSKRSLSRSQDRENEPPGWWGGLLRPGVIERETAFDRRSEHIRNSVISESDYGSDLSRTSSEKMEKLPKAWVI